MAKNINSFVLVENHQKFSSSNTVCGSSKNSIFANLCKENGAKIYDEKYMKIFNRFENRGRWMFLITIKIITNF